MRPDAGIGRIKSRTSLGFFTKLEFVVFRHALFEGLDALGDVTHEVRNLAASKQQQDDDDHEQPVPNAE